MDNKFFLVFIRQYICNQYLNMNKLTLYEKFCEIQANSKFIPSVYLGNLPQKPSEHLKQDSQSGDQYALGVKISSFYKSISPQYQNLCWESPNHQVLYPMVGIVAFDNNELAYNFVTVKTLNFIQSAGTRCVPIPSTLQVEELVVLIKNTQGLFIPSHENTKGALAFFQALKSILPDLSLAKYPIFAFGNSATTLLPMKEKQYNGSDHISQIFITHNNTVLMKGMDISLRLCVQNRKKISINKSWVIPFKNWDYSEKIRIGGIFKAKNSQWYVAYYQFCDSYVFGSFINPLKTQNPQSIALNHLMISNFMNLVRLNNKKIEEFQLISNYQLILGNSQIQSHYKIQKQ